MKEKIKNAEKMFRGLGAKYDCSYKKMNDYIVVFYNEKYDDMPWLLYFSDTDDFDILSNVEWMKIREFLEKNGFTVEILDME